MQLSSYDELALTAACPQGNQWNMDSLSANSIGFQSLTLPVILQGTQRKRMDIGQIAGFLEMIVYIPGVARKNTKTT